MKFYNRRKRAFLESHVRNHLYNFKNKPKRIVGKYNENHEKLINEHYQLSKLDLKNVIASRISKSCNTDISVNKVNLEKNIKLSDKNYIPRTPIFVQDVRTIPQLKFLMIVKLWPV